ncbi:hypothetical protein BpHYR1_016596 [Brachionus plicatilis]|uniref:RNA-directed DNA polymerase from mobile element jockey-like n=1 Tax=Brachionus plicatilis TaxID=10195 RepID=A0A3M7SKN9_BRAPC|nr:hypothetical protein BpHYR1_016596 [Brachionus plicatilis]
MLIIVFSLTGLGWNPRNFFHTTCLILQLQYLYRFLAEDDFDKEELISNKLNGNKIEIQKEIKFPNCKLNFNSMIDEIKERCSSRLKLIKILSNKKWYLSFSTVGNLYKSLIGSIIDYPFPCLNSLPEANIKKIQVILNSAVRFIAKLKFDTPSNILHHEALNKLK